MKVFIVRIGNKYGPEYEKYFEQLLPYDIHWIREPYDPAVMLQWNKMLPMNLPLYEPVCVMDIDIILTGNYRKIFEFPIWPGEFAAMPDWWNPVHADKGYSINGGFFKYYPVDCKYIFDKFMEKPQYWQNHYIKNGTTSGPVNGEQYFVEDAVKEQLELKLLPKEWFTRWATRETVLSYENLWADRTEEYYQNWLFFMEEQYFKATGNRGLYMDGEFHEDIGMIHFTNSMNKPHEWEDFHKFISYK